MENIVEIIENGAKVAIGIQKTNTNKKNILEWWTKTCNR